MYSSISLTRDAGEDPYEIYHVLACSLPFAGLLEA